MAGLSFPILPISPHSGDRGIPILPTLPLGEWEMGNGMGWVTPAGLWDTFARVRESHTPQQRRGLLRQPLPGPMAEHASAMTPQAASDEP